MRTFKLVLIAFIAFALMILMMANMTSVDLHLLPERFAPGLPVLEGVPLPIVIVLTFMAGLGVGLLMEYLRESKHRRRLDEKRREVSTLRSENTRLAQRLSEKGDEVAAITG